MMFRNPALRLKRDVPDLKVATSHIRDSKNNAQESASWAGCDRPCLLTLSVPQTYEAVRSVEHQKQPAVFHGLLRRFQGFKHALLAILSILYPKSNASPDYWRKIPISLTTCRGSPQSFPPPRAPGMRAFPAHKYTAVFLGDRPKPPID